MICLLCEGKGFYTVKGDDVDTHTHCAYCNGTGEVHGLVAAYSGGVIVEGFASVTDRAWAEQWADALAEV